MSFVKVFISTVKNEIKAIFSDAGAMLIIVFAMLIYTVIYSVAYGKEVVTDVVIGVIDEDHTQSSQRLIDGIRSGPNTEVVYEPVSTADAEEMFYNGDIYGVVYIPSGYELRLLSGHQANVGVVLDGSHLLLYRQVLEQAAADILTQGAGVEISRLMASGVDASSIKGVVEPVIYDSHTLYNSTLGYGSFVMPTIVVVIIQQTALIGIALVAVRRRLRGEMCVAKTICHATIDVLAKIFVYTILYSVNLTIILGVVWPIFGFPNVGRTQDVALLMLIYCIAVISLSLTISHLFRRRETPIIVLLWCSVPVLLLAGLSYPKEAFPSWLYALGELLPSSSAVRAFVDIGTMGASLVDVTGELYMLLFLAVGYLFTAIITEKLDVINKKNGLSV